MADMYVRRVGGGLVPDGAEAIEQLDKWPLDTVLLGKFTQPRNVKFHRKYFALMDLLWSQGGQHQFDNREAMRLWIQCKAGHYDLISKTTRNGDTTFVVRPSSISFAQMDETAFAQLYDKVIQVALDGAAGRILPATWEQADIDNYLAEVERFA